MKGKGTGKLEGGGVREGIQQNKRRRNMARVDIFYTFKTATSEG